MRFFRPRLAVVFYHEIEDVVRAGEYFKGHLGVEDRVSDFGANLGTSTEVYER